MGKNSQPQTTTQSNSPPPQVLANYQALTNRATANANVPYTPYQGEQVAPLTGQTQAGLGNVNNYAFSAQPAYQTAQNMTQQAGVGPTGQSLQPYMNPYTQSVINATQNQFNNQNQQQSQFLNSANISSGNSPFAGDRAGISQAVLANQQQSAQAPVIAGLNQANYSQALNEYNTQQQAQLAAAGQLGNLGTAAQTAGLQGANAQAQAGMVPQQQQQAIDSALMGQYAQSQAYPFQTTGWLSNIIQGLGSQTGGQSATSAPGPSGLSQGIGALTAGLGLASHFLARGGRIEHPHYDSGGQVQGPPRPGSGLAITPQMALAMLGSKGASIGLNPASVAQNAYSPQGILARQGFAGGGSFSYPASPDPFIDFASPSAIASGIGAPDPLSGVAAMEYYAATNGGKGVSGSLGGGAPGGTLTPEASTPGPVVNWKPPLYQGYGNPTYAAGAPVVPNFSPFADHLYGGVTSGTPGVAFPTVTGPAGAPTASTTTEGAGQGVNPYTGTTLKDLTGGSVTNPSDHPTPPPAAPAAPAAASQAPVHQNQSLINPNPNVYTPTVPGGYLPQDMGGGHLQRMYAAGGMIGQSGLHHAMDYVPPGHGLTGIDSQGNEAGFGGMFGERSGFASGGKNSPEAPWDVVSWVPAPSPLSIGAGPPHPPNLPDQKQDPGLLGPDPGKTGGDIGASLSKIGSSIKGSGIFGGGDLSKSDLNYLETGSDSGVGSPLSLLATGGMVKRKRRRKGGKTDDRLHRDFGGGIPNITGFNAANSWASTPGLAGNAGLAAQGLGFTPNAAYMAYAAGQGAGNAGIRPDNPNMPQSITAPFVQPFFGNSMSPDSWNKLAAGTAAENSGNVPSDYATEMASLRKSGAFSLPGNSGNYSGAAPLPPSRPDDLQGYQPVPLPPPRPSEGDSTAGGPAYPPPNVYPQPGYANSTSAIPQADQHSSSQFSSYGMPSFDGGGYGYPALGMSPYSQAFAYPRLPGLAPQTSSALAALQSALSAKGFGQAPVTSQYRSNDAQAQLVANMMAGRAGRPLPYPDRGPVKVAAAPGYSPHNFGGAFDTGLHGSALSYASSIAPSLGLQTIRGDPGHFQLQNYASVTPSYSPSQWAPHVSLDTSGSGRGGGGGGVPVSPVAQAGYFRAKGGEVPMPPPRPHDELPPAIAFRLKNFPEYKEGDKIPSGFMDRFQAAQRDPMLTQPIQIPQKFGYGEGEALGTSGLGTGDSARMIAEPPDPRDRDRFISFASGGSTRRHFDDGGDTGTAYPTDRTKTTPEQRLAFIQNDIATRYPGADPSRGVGIARAEGLNAPGVGPSTVDVDPRTGQPFSFQDFQMNMHPGALGDQALQRSGVDSRDPNQWQQSDRYAIDRIYGDKNVQPWSNDAYVKGLRGSSPPTGNNNSPGFGGMRAQALQDQLPPMYPDRHLGPITIPGDLPDAMMAAGFGMMAGRSPYAMVNIGEGGQKGMEYLQKEKLLQREYGLSQAEIRHYDQETAASVQNMNIELAKYKLLQGYMNQPPPGAEGYGTSSSSTPVTPPISTTVPGPVSTKVGSATLPPLVPPPAGNEGKLAPAGAISTKALVDLNRGEHGATVDPEGPSAPPPGGAPSAADMAALKGAMPNASVPAPDVHSVLATVPPRTGGGIQIQDKTQTTPEFSAPPVPAPSSSSIAQIPNIPPKGDAFWNGKAKEQIPYYWDEKAQQHYKGALLGVPGAERSYAVDLQNAATLREQLTGPARKYAEEHAGAVAKAAPDIAAAEAEAAREKAEATVGGKTMPEIDTQLGKDSSLRSKVEVRLQTLLDLNEKVETGALADIKENLSSWAQYLGVDPKYATNVQELTKNATAEIYQELKEQKGQVRNMEIQGYTKQMASSTNTPAANRYMLLQALGAVDKDNQYTNEYFKWRDSAGRKALSPGAFEAQFNGAHDPLEWQRKQFLGWASSHGRPSSIPEGSVLGTNKKGEPLWKDPAGHKYDWQGNPE